ncbi:competence type IV pilus major pilin ComGC [Companilactobacillus kimchiensis]|uniref:Competence protein ComGC n=1 Tax=Companilactobacillus kimchiensis TaxID=993692 RepID=A0A0R2L9U4_9LACO|nr:competence type IV pilus major pilin ComGC [Companilactobacillus kimchiensis]KRN98655.1 hypothetical protein IV57_GL001075 [Companilactobacillus kimchiensis]
MKKIHRAFTLIEMVIVLFIISLLLLIMIPNLAAQKEKADKRSDEAFNITIQTQKELYAEDHDGKSPTLAELKDGSYISNKQLTKAQKIEELKNKDDAKK